MLPSVFPPSIIGSCQMDLAKIYPDSIFIFDSLSNPSDMISLTITIPEDFESFSVNPLLDFGKTIQRKQNKNKQKLLVPPRKAPFNWPGLVSAALTTRDSQSWPAAVASPHG